MFKVGDQVRIKSNLTVDKLYNGCYFIPEMEYCRGKTGIITEMYHDNYQTRRYKLDISQIYYFSNDMLEIVPSYQVEDRVRIINEMPKNRYGILSDTWLEILGKPGKIINTNITDNTYLVFISAIKNSFWFPPEYFKKESTLTSENPIWNVSKLIEYIPEIELSYCKKQIYTI